MSTRPTCVQPSWKLPFLLALAAVWGLVFAGPPAWAGADEPPVLARVEVAGPLRSFPLPVHAHLLDQAGRDYLLVHATPAQLQQTGWTYQMLDRGRPEDYVLARAGRPDARTAAAGKFAVVYDDGVNWLVRAPGAEAQPLPPLGFGLARLPKDPLVWTRPAAAAALALDDMPDSRVQTMIGNVADGHLLRLMRELVGGDAVVAGGDLYAIASRTTYSGQPILKATQFCYDHLRALGLTASSHDWGAGYNVLGVQPGGAKANEVVVLVAHLDSAVNPGQCADDNASGAVALLQAAELFRQYRFERTVRFLLVTGEEQGLLGSAAYATAAAAAGDNIVAVLNLDMISWDSNADGRLNLFTRPASDPGYASDLALATTFASAVAAYGLDGAGGLQPVICATGMGRSDHASFWNVGYPAILGIEDDQGGDFNPYYHTADDTLDRINWGYFNHYVRAATATAAHLAGIAGEVSREIVQVATADTAPGTGLGASVFHAKCEPGATETGTDPLDTAWADEPANPNSRWLRIHTAPYGTALATDSRLADNAAVFSGQLSAVLAGGGTLSCANRLRFDFLTPPRPTRSYLARVHVDGAFTATATDFDYLTDLRSLVASGGYLDLPPLVGLQDGVVYGTCDVIARFDETPISYAGERTDDSAGNADGVINPGERVKLWVSLLNVSSGLTGVAATLSCADSYVTVTDNAAAYGELPGPWATKEGADPFEIEVAGDCPTPREVTFSLNVADADGGNWTTNFALLLYTSGRIAGRVVKITGGAGIAGATVAFTGPKSGTVTTDADGAYLFAGLGGTYTLLAGAAGFLDSAPLQVTIPPSATGVDFALGRAHLAVTPAALSVTVAPGAAATTPLTIGNTGDAPLTWTLPAGDYVVATSDQPGGPAYAWTEIAGTGTQIGGFDDDDNAGPFAVGFSFPFYGNTFTSFRLCSNGWLSFTNSDTSFRNTALPSTVAPENLVAFCWDDLIFVGGSTAWYQLVAADTLVVEFKDVAFYADPAKKVTCQALLKADGTIQCQYQAIALATGCTVGVQNADRTKGVQVVCNAALLHAGLAVQLAPSAAWITLAPTAGTTMPGGDSAVTAIFNAAGLAVGTYATSVQVASNDLATPVVNIPATLTVAPADNPPVIVSPAWADPNPVTLPAGTTVHVVASDPDGDPLTYAWSQLNGAGTVTWATPDARDSGVTFSAAGTYVLRVTVSDGRGGSVTSDVTVTVNAGSGVDPRADVNHDAVVNALDLQIVIANFGQSVGDPGCDVRADANADGVVNALDLQIVIANFGQTVP